MDRIYKTVSIIGCGFLGYPLALRLVQEGYNVYGTSTTPSKVARLREDKVKAYVLKADERAITTNAPQELWKSEVFVITLPPLRNSPRAATNYPQRIKRILEKIAVAAKASLVIFTSSVSVYGNQNQELFEHTALKPQGITAKACALAEQYLLSFSSSVCILRLAGLIGGKRLAGRFLAGKKDLANGDMPVNLVRVEDVVNVIAKLIRRKTRSEVYNVCADEHPRRAEFYPAVTRKLGLEEPTFLTETEGKYPARKVANQKIKMALNYTFIPLDYA